MRSVPVTHVLQVRPPRSRHACVASTTGTALSLPRLSQSRDSGQLISPGARHRIASIGKPTPTWDAVRVSIFNIDNSHDSYFEKIGDEKWRSLKIGRDHINDHFPSPSESNCTRVRDLGGSVFLSSLPVSAD